MNKTKITIISIVVLAVVAVAVAAMYYFGVFESKPYDYDLSEYIKVGKYKGLEYEKAKISVTDEEIDAEINSRLKQSTKTENVKSGTVESGDTVNISYEGKIDGKTFDGGSSDSHNLTIGSGAFIPGFEDGLIGKKIGETVELNLKFPTGYRVAELAGKDVVFKVTLNYKSVQKVPELNDEFVKDNSDFKTVAEYKQDVKKTIAKRKEKAAEAETVNILWNDILSKTEVKKYPEKELKEMRTSMDKKYHEMAKQNNLEFTEFLKTYFNMDEKEYKKQLEAAVKSSVKENMTVYYIADKEGISVSSRDIKESLEKLLKQSNMTEETFKAQFGMTIYEYADQMNYRDAYISNLVKEKILKLGKAK